MALSYPYRFQEFLKSRPALYGILILLPAIIYLNTLGNGFVWDDKYVLVENSYIRDVSNIPAFFTSSRTQASYDMLTYRPLRQVMFTLEYPFFGTNPAGYHLVNAIIHAVNVLLLFILLERLSMRTLLAFLVALLYSVHPLNVEAVANITGRTDLLFLLFYLSGLIFLVRYYDDKTCRKRYLLILSASFYCLTLASKEMAISFPLVAGIIYFYNSQREIRKHSTAALYFCGLALISVLYFLIRSYALKEMGNEFYYGDSFFVTMFTETAIILKYIRLFFIPYPLTIRYDIFLVDSAFNAYSLTFLGVIAFLLYRTVIDAPRKKLSLAHIGAWWFLITLLPVANIIPIRGAMMAERYLYLPMIGLLMLVFSTAQSLLQRKSVWSRSLPLAVYAIFLGAFVVMTVLRISVWKDNLTIFEDAVTKAPDSLAVHWNLFEEYRKTGNYEKASMHYMEMLRINEMVANNLLAIAIKYKEQGKLNDAKRMAGRALKTKPDFRAAQTFLSSLDQAQKP